MLHDAKVELTCDTKGCTYSETFDCTAIAGCAYDTRNVETDAVAEGWTWVSDDVHYCPSCTEDRADA